MAIREAFLQFFLYPSISFREVAILKVFCVLFIHFSLWKLHLSYSVEWNRLSSFYKGSWKNIFVKLSWNLSISLRCVLILISSFLPLAAILFSIVEPVHRFFVQGHESPFQWNYCKSIHRLERSGHTWFLVFLYFFIKWIGTNLSNFCTGSLGKHFCDITFKSIHRHERVLILRVFFLLFSHFGHLIIGVKLFRQFWYRVIRVTFL